MLPVWAPPPPLEQVQKDLEYFPFEVTAGPNGECLYQVSRAAFVQAAGCLDPLLLSRW